jgi:hypothetical protein
MKYEYYILTIITMSELEDIVHATDPSLAQPAMDHEAPISTPSYEETELVVYHGGCPDGTGGAWCLWKKFKKPIEYYGAMHDSNSKPYVKNKKVVFVDFAYPLEDMIVLCHEAKYIIVIDHHKTSIPLASLNLPNFKCILDMNRSGAQMAWDELNPGTPRPWFIDDIADRDLWAWKIVGSKSVGRAFLELQKFRTVESMDTIDKMSRKTYVTIGEALLLEDEAHIEAIVNSAIECTTATMVSDLVKEWKVRVVECEHTYASEVGNRLVLDKCCDFSVMFRYDANFDTFWCSARAHKDSRVDLTTIIKSFDPKAGGHPKAAGFSVHDWRLVFHPINSKEKTFTTITENY